MIREMVCAQCAGDDFLASAGGSVQAKYVAVGQDIDKLHTPLENMRMACPTQKGFPREAF